MKKTATICILVLAATLPLAPVRAEVKLDAVKSCVDASTSAGTSPAPCIDQAQAECAAIPGETNKVATLCFARAQEVWSDGIRAELDRISAVAPEEIAAIAAIEVKYDMISGLVQCDRLAELALVGEAATDAIERNKAHCSASATALSYVNLLWRAQDLK